MVAARWADFTRHPLRFSYNPIARFYKGGARAQAFRGLANPRDNDAPEDWIASCTEAAGTNIPGVGLSRIDGPERVLLRELLEAEPEALLGAAFVERWGVTTGSLVKLLSPSERLPLHAHPSRPFAQCHWGCAFGKTEAWIILEADGDGKEPAYVGVGFKEHVTRQTFADAVERQDSNELMAMVHRLEVRAGDVFFISAGLPHLIGPGTLMIEVQEPTDLGVLAEWKPFLDKEADARGGLSWEQALDVYDYQTFSRAGVLQHAQPDALVQYDGPGGRVTSLFGTVGRDFFEAQELLIQREIEINDGRFSTYLVVEGKGVLEGDFEKQTIHRGESLACAASLPHRFRAEEGLLKVLRLLGPQV